jgi:hypothetical protein
LTAAVVNNAQSASSRSPQNNASCASAVLKEANNKMSTNAKEAYFERMPQNPFQNDLCVENANQLVARTACD